MITHKLKLPACMRRFIKEQSVVCKASTIGTYITHLRNFCSFLRSEFNTNTVMSKHIALIDKNLLNSFLIKLHNQKLAPYSRVQRLNDIRKYLAWETERGNIAKSVLENFDRSRLPKVPDYLPRPLSNETDQLLVARLRDSTNPYAKAFLLLRLTGLRISELINLTCDCVITTARNESFLKVPLGKMNNERLVPLCAEAIDIIQNLKSSHAIRGKHRNLNRLIGLNGKMSKAYARISAQFKKITADISDQNKPVTFHRLRHTYATSLLSGGVSIVSIMKLLGHRRIEMSLRYAQITPTHIRNEYFKALKTLEAQYIPKHDPQPKLVTTRVAPTEIISQLALFIKKETCGKLTPQKNLIRRLSRLATDLQKSNLPNNFPILHTKNP